MRISGLVILALAGVAAPALAADQNGYQAIVAGDLATAERSIVAERQIYPDRPELMLNLAAVYRSFDWDGPLQKVQAAADLSPTVLPKKRQKAQV